jgi:hypothetical protein
MITDECDVLDQLDQVLVESIPQEKINEFVDGLKSPDSCVLLDVEEATIDPRHTEIRDKELKDLFIEIHRQILLNGVDMTREVHSIYEFVIQLDNERPLDIDFSKHRQN